MRYFNVFYLSILVIGVLLWRWNTSYRNGVVSFYGFAETKETEINFNYPVAVGKIHVTPGQFVKAGDTLLDLYRIKPKEVLEDQGFRIDELRAKENLWRTEKKSKIEVIASRRDLKLEEIDAAIRKLEEQKTFQQSLYRDLKSVRVEQPDYQPITSRIEALQKERSLAEASFGAEIRTIEKELEIGGNPYQVEINRLAAERAFDQSNKIIPIQLQAPTDGIIGNIHCKISEHIPSFRTLITFYEPNPTLVQGFVQEDLILHVALQDSFLILSEKEETTSCLGIVTGLGSRIVEIPERMRKIPDLKTYGREVLVQIPPDNNFLQKEKVVLQFLKTPEGVMFGRSRKPLVDLEIDQQ